MGNELSNRHAFCTRFSSYLAPSVVLDMKLQPSSSSSFSGDWMLLWSEEETAWEITDPRPFKGVLSVLMITPDPFLSGVDMNCFPPWPPLVPEAPKVPFFPILNTKLQFCCHRGSNWSAEPRICCTRKRKRNKEKYQYR